MGIFTYHQFLIKSLFFYIIKKKIGVLEIFLNIHKILILIFFIYLLIHIFLTIYTHIFNLFLFFYIDNFLNSI